jgi:hydroxymethylglutaryl-CoA lyase
MDSLIITDVGPRDGLQSQHTLVSTHDKLRLIHALFGAGLKGIEATSFVSPRAVPQMADADVLLPQVVTPSGASLSVLVPNLRGLERAVTAQAAGIAVVLSASDTMNRKNIGMGLDAATEACIATLTRAASLGLHRRAYLAVAFECPFEGITPASRVRELALLMGAAGAEEIVIADTIGAAGPTQVQGVLHMLLASVPATRLGMHFHDTRGMALANAWTSIELGIRRFDASIGGLGGCPFAPGAAGNLATEDLVLMASQCGLDTGVDLAALLGAAELAQDLVGYPIGGRSMRWLRSAASGLIMDKEKNG